MKDNDSFIKNEAYEIHAENYVKGTEKKTWIVNYERPTMLSIIEKHVNNIQGKKILDCGCATGYYSDFFINKGADVTALDSSSAMVEITKKRTQNKAKVYNADLNYPLDFIENNSIDVVVCSLVLHYIKDWSLIMSEFHRIMKKDSIIISSTHHPINDFSLFKKDNYHDTELVKDEWKFDVSFNVEYYTRPLHKYIMPYINAGFILTDLIEPFPPEDLKNLKPDTYYSLIQKPGFLFLVASKK